jgi:uncharacterized membrane protein
MKNIIMAESNPNSRLEAFCDGVFAIALTLLILEIKIPPSETIKTTSELWAAFQHLLPSVFAFLLSFIIIFISWFNHHTTLKLVHKTSPGFIYANGFILLTIAIMPFPTALLSEYLFTDHAAPAVVIYAAISALNAIAWIVLFHAILQPKPLTSNDRAAQTVRAAQPKSYLALGIYALCAILAFWFPQAVAFLLSAIWIVWLIYGVSVKAE